MQTSGDRQHRAYHILSVIGNLRKELDSLEKQVEDYRDGGKKIAAISVNEVGQRALALMYMCGQANGN